MSNFERQTEATAAPTPAAPTATEPASATGPGTRRIDNKTPVAAPTGAEEIEVRINCLMNARYHSSREAFLDTVHRWLMFLVILFGATAIIDVVPKDKLIHAKEISAALAALMAALDLTFDLSNRARVHSLMKRRYFELLADLVEGKKTVVEIEAGANRYSADEEPAYHALLAASWNAAQEMVLGDQADRYQIPRHHVALKNVWRYPARQYDLEPKKA